MKKKTESNFLRYLKSTKKMTADWPEWKKEALKTRSAEHDVLDDHDALIIRKLHKIVAIVLSG